MFLDGLEDAYDKGRLMGTFAEDCAEATNSPAAPRMSMPLRPSRRRKKASADGSFAEEIVP